MMKMNSLSLLFALGALPSWGVPAHAAGRTSITVRFDVYQVAAGAPMGSAPTSFRIEETYTLLPNKIIEISRSKAGYQEKETLTLGAPGATKSVSSLDTVSRIRAENGMLIYSTFAKTWKLIRSIRTDQQKDCTAQVAFILLPGETLYYARGLSDHVERASREMRAENVSCAIRSD